MGCVILDSDPRTSAELSLDCNTRAVREDATHHRTFGCDAACRRMGCVLRWSSGLWDRPVYSRSTVATAAVPRLGAWHTHFRYRSLERTSATKLQRYSL